MPNVQSILRDRVEFQIESIDRVFLNLYQPRLQCPDGLLRFLHGQRRQPIASPALLGQMTTRFVQGIKEFAEAQDIPIVHFQKGVRKEEVARSYFDGCSGKEGVVLVGVAQERASTFRSRKHKESGGRVRFHFYRGSVAVNHYYFYLLDEDFGPAFIKLCSCFPFTGRVWLNGHQWAKRQLTRLGLGYEALDNGFLAVDDPDRAQRVCDGLSAERVEAFVRKWLARLPSPFLPEDEDGGYRYELSILQFEMSLTTSSVVPWMAGTSSGRSSASTSTSVAPTRCDWSLTAASPGELRVASRPG